MRLAILSVLLMGVAGIAQAEMPVAWTLDGFSSPESVGRDPATGTIYVSNFGKDPMSKDGDGFLSTITADGKMAQLTWLSGLNAPKGIDFVGSKLYVADIDQLVEVDTASGQITGRFKADGATFLNDVAAGPDGRVYVSDTFGAAVYVLEAGKLSLFVQDPMLMGANGLIVEGGSLLVADLGDISGGFANIKPGPVVRIDLASKALSAYGAAGPVGVLDGIELDGSGGVLLTDNPTGRLLALQPGGVATEVAKVASGAADLEVDTADGLVLVPVTAANQVVALKRP